MADSNLFNLPTYDLPGFDFSGGGDAGQNFADSFKTAQVNQAFRRANQDVERSKKLLLQAGIEPEIDDSPGLLTKVFDVLGAPGNFVRGGIAKLVGLEDYQDEDYLAAAKLGVKNNLTVGDILRQKDILSEDNLPTSAARAVLGFVGDVATDPLTFLGGLPARLGGTAVTTSKLATKFGELTPQALHGALTKNAFEKLSTNFADDLASGVIKLDDLQFAAAKEASRGFQELTSHLAKVKKFGLDASTINTAKDAANAEKIIKGTAEAFDAFGLKQKSAELVETLGLTSADELAKIPLKRAIRGTGLLPGVGEGIMSIGILNKKVFDIPIITDVSAKALEALSGPMYNRVVQVGSMMNNAIQAGKQSKNPLFAWPAGFADLVKKGAQGLPKVFSPAALAGGKEEAAMLREHDVAIQALRGNTMELAEQIFTDSRGAPFDEKILEEASRVLQSGVSQRMANIPGMGLGQVPLKVSMKDLRAQGLSLVEETRIFEEALNDLRSTYNTLTPGLGDDIAKVALRVRGDFDRYGKEAVDAGYLDRTIEGYVKQSYRLNPAQAGWDEKVQQELHAGRFAKTPSFTLARTFASMDEAGVAGLIPEFNLKKIWTERTFAQGQAMAELELAERSAYEFAIPKATRNAIAEMMVSRSGDEASRAIDIAKKLGLNFDHLDFESKLGKEFGVLRHPDTALPLRMEQYDQLQELIMKGSTGKSYVNSELVAKAQGVADKLKLNFSPEEREAIGLRLNAMDSVLNQRLGRAGETAFTRAGGDVLPKRFQEMLMKSLPEGSAEAEWVKGVLPRPLVNAIADSLDQRSGLQRYADSLKAKGEDPMKSAIYSLVKGYTGWVKNLKVMATVYFPSFHGRNLISGQLMQTQIAPLLGRSLSPFNAIKSWKFLQGGKSGIQAGTGQEITSGMLLRGMKEYAGVTRAGDMAELVAQQAAALHAINGTSPGFGDKMLNFKPVKKISEWIENFGRQQLFYNLVMNDGWDMPSAGREVARVMVDYAHGKTKFEKDWINNIIFFYSFSKANVANSVHALISRPGALTVQLHAVDAVREAIMDTDASLPPDLDAKIQSLRSKESLSRFLGRDAKGMPELLTNTGMPIEDVTRFFNLRAPKSMSLGDIIDAGSDGASRTVQTIASQMNPILRFPMEVLAFRHNLFFDRSIDDLSLRRIPKMADDLEKLSGSKWEAVSQPIYQGLDSFTKGFLKGKDNGDGTYTVDPTRLALMTYLVPGFARSTSQMAQFDKEGVSLKRKLLQFTTGVKVQSIDPQKAEVFENRRKLNEQFVREGLRQSRSGVQQYLKYNKPPGSQE